LCGKLADAFGFSQSVSHYVVEVTRATSQHPFLLPPHIYTHTNALLLNKERNDELNGSGKCWNAYYNCMSGRKDIAWQDPKVSNNWFLPVLSILMV